MKIRTLAMLLLSTTMLFSCGKTKKEIKYEDVIIDKYTKQTLDNFATWFWDIPQMKTLYYFKLEKFSEKEVNEYDYNHFTIGDTYTWVEYVYE